MLSVRIKLSEIMIKIWQIFIFLQDPCSLFINAGFTAALSSQIGRDEGRVIAQRLGRPGVDDLAAFHHIDVIRDL